MNRSIKWAILGIIIVVAAVVLLNQGSGEGEEAIADFPFQSLDEISDSGLLVEDYTNTELGYRIKYPSAWHLIQSNNYVSLATYNGEDPDIYSKIKDWNQEAKMEIYMVSEDEAAGVGDINKWAEDNLKRQPNEGLIVTGTKEIGIAGERAILKIGNVHGKHFPFFYIPHDGKIYIITGPALTNPHIDVFYEILKSFEFLPRTK